MQLETPQGTPLSHGDVVVIYSQNHQYLGPAETSLTRAGFNNEHLEKVTIGLETFQMSNRPTLTGAQDDAIPFAILRIAGAGTLYTGDSFLMRALETKLTDHSYLTVHPTDAFGAVNGIIYYGAMEPLWPPSPQYYAWAAQDTQRGRAMFPGVGYSLASMYAGDIGGAFLTVLPVAQSVQNSQLVTTNEMQPTAATPQVPRWTFERVATLVMTGPSGSRTADL